MGSFFQSFPVSASFSRSAVKFQSGAVTGMTAVFSALIVGRPLLFYIPFLYLPIAVLAGIIMVAVVRLVNIRYAIDLYKTRRDEFFFTHDLSAHNFCWNLRGNSYRSIVFFVAHGDSNIKSTLRYTSQGFRNKLLQNIFALKQMQKSMMIFSS